MIEISSLNYRYPDTDVNALQDVDLSIDSNETLLLAGMSGSGKSTFLRVINGLVPHFFGGVFSGEAVINDQRVRTSSPAKLAAVVGTVFQEPRNRFLTSSVEDEVAFGLELAGLPGAEIHKRVNELIDRFDLGPLIGRKLDQLSAGEQQRVAIAAALGRVPKVLLLDEPTSQLDPPSSQAVLNWVAELGERYGLTTIIAEHRMDRLVQFVDRMAYLSENGTLEAVGSINEVVPHIPLAPSVVRAVEKCGLSGNLDTVGHKELVDHLTRIPYHRDVHSERGADPVLTCKGISHNYNGILAVDDVSLDLYPGEIAAVVGHNGAGKSTLLRCLIGLISPDTGEVLIEGERMTGRSVTEFAKKVAYVPQWPSALLFADTVRDELLFTLKNHGLDETPPLDPNELLDQFGLLSLRHRYPRDLSAGQRQRVALASVLITKPQIILLDEPTLGMDPDTQSKLSLLLHTLRTQGAAILIATHDVEFAAAYTDRVVILENGRIEADGPTAETLFSKPHLQTSLQRVTGMPWPASPEQIAH